MLDVAETICMDNAAQADQFERMAQREPHFVADLRAQLDDEPEPPAEVIEDMAESDMADIIDIGRRVAETSRKFKERAEPESPPDA